MTPAAPPSAETVWLRIGYTLEITATRSCGSVSASSMAARRPAPPPPTMRTSWSACIRPSALVHRGVFLQADLPTVVHDPPLNGSVVVLPTRALAAAVPDEVLEDEALLVVVQHPVPIDGTPARGGLAGEPTLNSHGRRPCRRSDEPDTPSCAVNAPEGRRRAPRTADLEVGTASLRSAGRVGSSLPGDDGEGGADQDGERAAHLAPAAGVVGQYQGCHEPQ